GQEGVPARGDAREGEQIADELLHASSTVEGAGNIATRLGIHLVRKAVLEELDVTTDGPQRFLQVVRGDVSELFQVAVGALEVLGGMLEGGLGAFALGNVAQEDLDGSLAL